MNFLISKIVVIISILGIYYPLISADIQLKKGWAKPSAWQKDIPSAELESSDTSTHCDCSLIEQNESLQGKPDIVLVFYKKLLKMLFDREGYSEDASGNLRRAILFKLSKNELNLIEMSTDPRDWDEFVTKVFTNAEEINDLNTNSSQNDYSNVFDSFKIYLSNSWFSYIEINVVTISICFIFPMLLLHTKYNYNLIALGLLIIFAIGYYNEYKDCNSELAIKKVVDMLDYQDSKNPCEGFDIQGTDIKFEKKPWYKFWSQTSKKEECAEYLRQQSKKMENSEYCRPDHVLFQYIYNIYKIQLGMLIHNSVELNKKIIKETPFPWNYLAVGAFLFLTTTFLTLFFKYIISPLIARIPSLRDNVQQIQSQSQLQNQNHESYHDLLRLQNNSINQLTKLTALTVQQALNAGSRVEIIETIENISPVELLTAPTNESTSQLILEDKNEMQDEIHIEKEKIYDVKLSTLPSTSTSNLNDKEKSVDEIHS